MKSRSFLDTALGLFSRGTPIHRAAVAFLLVILVVLLHAANTDFMRNLESNILI